MAEPKPPKVGVPKVVSHYRIGKLLGGGGMGEVYMATDRRDGSTVAVKLLHAHLAHDESFRDRFEREAHVGALLRSPYTVHLLDHGTSEGRYYLAMEYVEGVSLNEELRKGPMPARRALRIAGQVARALEEAEARGVIHRDIKPDNVFIGANDAVKVGDFGIARQVGGGTLTTPGAFVGTLAYAAPELALGRADHRSDIYSLGATLYHVLTGRPPFQGDVLEMLRHHAETPLPTETLAAMPAEVREIIVRCLEKDPDRRYQSASALAGALEHAATAAPDVPEEEAATEVATIAGSQAPPSPPDVEATTEVVPPLPPVPPPSEGEGAPTEVKPPAGEPTAVPVAMTLEMRESKSGGRFGAAQYDIMLHNGGAEATEVRLAAADSENLCAFSLPDSVSVPGGGATKLRLGVRPKFRRWRGGRQVRNFTVSASGGGGPPITAAGQFEDVPYGWVPAGALAVAGVVPAAIVAALMLGGGGEDGGRPASSLTAEDLSKIVLSKGDLGSDYASFVPDADNFGHITGDARASASCDPEHEMRLIEEAGWLRGYVSAYVSEEVRAAGKGAFSAETSVDQYGDSSGAALALDSAMNDPAAGLGQPECSHVEALETFEPGDIGDGSAGVQVQIDASGGGYSLTIVGFTREALVGKVVITHLGPLNYRDYAAALARKMDERMRQALDRDVVAASTARPSRTGSAAGTKSTPTPGGSAGSTPASIDETGRATPKPATGGQTNPPATQKPASTPRVTAPPVTNPPVTNPPVTNPPVTNPPATNPPPTSQAEFLLYADFVSVPAGGTVTVNIWVDAPSPGLGLYDFDLEFDSWLLTATWCDSASGGDCYYPDDASVAFTGYSGAAGDSIFLGSIDFQAGFDTGSVELTIYAYEMEDVNGTDVWWNTIELGGEVQIY